MNNNMILLWIMILAVLLLSAPTKCARLFNDNNKEGFFTGVNYKNYCSSCGWKNRSTCGNCINCGYCVTPSGKGECVAGDSRGPYFREDCMFYKYGRPYYGYPLDHIYPADRIKYVYPKRRWMY
jgi:hypothetical protein